MLRTIEAIFDGSVLCPTEPLLIEPNTRLRLSIEWLASPGEPSSFLDVAQALELDGPPDWSENLDAYLYAEALDAER